MLKEKQKKWIMRIIKIKEDDEKLSQELLQEFGETVSEGYDIFIKRLEIVLNKKSK